MHTPSRHKPFPLIGIAAKAQSGKTTVANLLQKGALYKHVSFAEPIRQFVSDLTGISRADLEDAKVKEAVIPWIGKSPRQLMQTLGTEWGRELVREDFWIRRAMAEVERIEFAGGRAVISDVRFDNEAQAIRDHGGVVLHLVRPDALVVASHASESGVTKQPGDYTIVNDGSLMELAKKVDVMTYHFWQAAR